MDLSILHNISYGLYLVGASEEGRPVGCIVNTAVQITSDPLTVAVSLSKNNYTLEVIRAIGRFSLSILTEETPQEVIAVFGYRSSRDTDKFDAVPFRWDQMTPLPQAACCGHLICQTLEEVDRGSHVVVFAKVLDALPGASSAAPMTYRYYHQVRKAAAPKNAPTYQAPGTQQS